MARGLISGLVVGGVVSVVGLGTVSLLSPLPESPDVADTPAGVTSPTTGDGQDRPASGADADVVEIAPTAPSTEAGADDLAVLEDSDTEPAAKPAVGGKGDGLSDPAQGGSSPDVSTNTDSTPATDGAATTPNAPASDATLSEGTEPAQRPSVGDASVGLDNPSEAGSAPDVSAIAERPSAPNPGGLADPDSGDQPISTVPAQPAAPDVAENNTAFQPAPEVGEAPEVTGATDAPVTGDTVAGITQPNASGATPDTDAVSADKPDTSADPAQPEAATGSTVTDAASPEQPVTAPKVSSEAPAQPAPAPTQPVSPEPAEPAAPRVAALPQSGTDETTEDTGPTIGTRVTPLTERDSGGSSLPSVSEAAATGDGAASDEPPIRRFATPFENPENKPLMSIVLIDDVDGLGAEALQGFPYPLTFAVDPSDPEALEKLARHREAGFEVALLTNLPQAATPQDAEVALEAALAALPETVALFEGVGSGFQGNRPLSDQITAIAEGTGRGMVTQRNGLNTVQKLAARKGVPSAVVFRDFDGAGQSPDTIRRFLDQAAFRADQEGAVVMLGRVRPETISALLLWGLQDRASRVALAPLSAGLLRKGAN
ncbi:MAG: divergent polysaccharide deacetylase family protein [Paracoccaceae bacterium]